MKKRCPPRDTRKTGMTVRQQAAITRLYWVASGHQVGVQRTYSIWMPLDLNSWLKFWTMSS